MTLDSTIDSAIADIKQVIARIRADPTLTVAFDNASIKEKIEIVEMVFRRIEGK